jgi:hypothetical protein
MAAQRSYLVATIRNDIESLEGQMVRAGTAPEVAVGERIDWTQWISQGEPLRVPHEVVEVREATDHFESVVVLRRSDA